jgi:selT/selW/selH-like putative selenoprotein
LLLLVKLLNATQPSAIIAHGLVILAQQRHEASVGCAREADIVRGGPQLGPPDDDVSYFRSLLTLIPDQVHAVLVQFSAITHFLKRGDQESLFPQDCRELSVFGHLVFAPSRISDNNDALSPLVGTMNWPLEDHVVPVDDDHDSGELSPVPAKHLCPVGGGSRIPSDCEFLEYELHCTTVVTPKSPRIEIEYCTQCRWLLRAAWMAQELLTTFQSEIGEVALIPGTGGVLEIRLDSEVI